MPEQNVQVPCGFITQSATKTGNYLYFIVSKDYVFSKYVICIKALKNGALAIKIQLNCPIFSGKKES